MVRDLRYTFRTFRERDGALGADAVLMLSHGCWQRRLAGDPDIVGRVFEMNRDAEERIHVALRM